MNTLVVPPSDDDEESLDQLRKQVSRLERRLERERKVRRDAEVIADRGMRELWLTNRELDARVEQRTADLVATLEDLKLASSSRKKFLSTLSHEMRTPLNGLLGMLELLAPHISDEQGQEYLRTANQSAVQLHRLIRRLLDLVELESGAFETRAEAIPVLELVDSVRLKWQQQAAQTGHLLIVSSQVDSSDIKVDKARLHQIIDELIDNAVTHANPGLVEVGLSSNEERLVVEVKDSGPGIDPNRIESLFSEFSMADGSTQRMNDGLGLGLSLSRRVAQALGGSFSMASDGSTGTSARLEIPVEFLVEHKKELSNQLS